MIRAAFGCRSVVGRNAYHLGHVEPILAKSADGCGPKCGDMLLALYLPSTTHALLEYKTSRL